MIPFLGYISKCGAKGGGFCPPPPPLVALPPFGLNSIEPFNHLGLKSGKVLTFSANGV